MFMPSILNDNLFDDFFGVSYPKKNSTLKNVTGMMKTDIRESEDGFNLDIDLPGYAKEDITAELKDGYMTITAEKKSEDDKSEEAGHYIRRERFYGSVSRSFYVGEQITEEDIKAKFEDGILNVFVPKKEEVKKEPERKLIAIA